MEPLTLNKRTYLSTKRKKVKYTKENPNIHLKPNSNLNIIANISSNKTYQKKKNANILETLIVHLKP